MKRKFLSVILFSALIVGTTGTVTSCKDYDDDIKDLQEQIDKKASTDDLTQRLATLQSSVDAAQRDAASALSKAQEAYDKAKEAYDKAAAAGSSAQDAYNKAAEAYEQAIAAGSSATEAYNKAKEAYDAAAAAGTSEETQQAINDLDKAVKELAELIDKKADLTSVSEEIKALEGKLTNYASKSDLNGKASTAALEELEDEVARLEAKVLKLIGSRLTSVTLVPDLYVGGIETIEFLSLKYRPMTYDKAKGMIENPSVADIIVSSEENPAHYRLSPANVNVDCIDKAGIEFLAYKAQTREVVSSPIAYVTNSATIDNDGIMTVYAKKSITGSLNLTPEGEDGPIYTVALKVPIKDEYRTDEDADECVYSEYSRLSESTMTPKIAALPYVCSRTAGHSHYSDSLSVWGMRVTDAAPANIITKEVLYDSSLDLRTLVTGCIQQDAREITVAELAKYGLEFRFAIPTTAYTTGAVNNTDQQQFAKLQSDGCTVVSKLPNGVTNNKAAIDKEPIVRVTLWDKVNAKIVDQRYLKIRWTNKTVAPVDLGIKEFKRLLGCDAVDMDITWADFINTVYGQVKDEKLDMSEDQFMAVYPYSTNISVVGPGSASWRWGGAHEGDALFLKWTLDPSDIGTIVKYDNGATTPTLFNNVFTMKITFTPTNSDYPVLTYTLKTTVELPTLPSINGYYDQYWYSKYDAHDVLPVQYNTAAQTRAYCVFENNLMNAFTYNSTTGLIIKDMTSCGNWDMQFALKQNIANVVPEYYTPTAVEPLKTAGVSYSTFEAYSLLNNNTQAMRLNWDPSHMSWCNNPAHYQANLFADHNNAANQSLLNPLSAENEADGITPKRTHDKKIQMSIWATINPYNYILVKNYSICLVAPLRIEAQLDGYFEEGLVSGSSIDCSKAFKMTDFRGYEVAAVTTDLTNEYKKYASDLYKYYEVQPTNWDLNAVRYGMKVVNGSIVIDDNLTAAQGMTAAEINAATNGNINLSITQSGTTLTFKNNGGSNVETKCNVFIPASVTYGFGTITTNVKVTLYPKGQAPQN